MQLFFTFVTHHWELWLAFFAILVALLATELHSKIYGLKSVSPQQAIFAINREDAVVLDLRTNELFIKGHIVDAINIPFDELSKKLEQLEKFKTKPIILVPNNNQTPNKADALLENNGFTNIRAINGGIDAWRSAGLPLVKGK